MTAQALVLVLGALLAVPLAWALPARMVWNGLAGWTLLVLASLSPASALWLAGSSLLTTALMAAGDRLGQRTALAAFGTLVLVGALGVSALWPGITWVGPAYFTLRHLHVLAEWWMGRLPNPGLARQLRYQLFLPVLMAGPIHRLPHFERQCARRRWDAPDFFAGAERALFGAAQAVVLGGWLMGQARRWLAAAGLASGFWQDWLLSALDWVQLYLRFAGLSSLALGLALMMGLRLEENFNRPWAARNLIEFWQRWHITLSSWCRDYVFQPVTALTRSPLIGLVAAMIAIGLWHQASTYYLLWGLWQVGGIVATRQAQALIRRHPALAFWPAAAPVAGPLAVMAWLSLAHPALTRLLALAPP